jgi:hypothetical protein
MAATEYRLHASEDGCTYEPSLKGAYEWLRELADDLASQGTHTRVVKHWTHWGQPQRKTLYQVGPQR